MSIFNIFPAVAAFSYAGLFVLTLINRPWSRQQKLFMIFLVAAAIWSVGDFLLRSPFFEDQKLLLLRLVIISSLCWVVQFYYFCRVFLNLQRDFGVYIGYSSLAVTVILCLLGIIPPGVTVINWEVHPVYGWWTALWVGPMLFLTTLIIIALVKRLRTQISPEERNKINYLVCAIALLSILGIPSVASIIKDLSLGSIGGILCAAVLTFAVVKHELISINVFLRRLLGWSTLFVICVIVFEIIQVIWHFTFRMPFNPVTILSSLLGAAAVTSIVLWMRPFFLEKLEQLFYRERYKHRRELLEFVSHKMRDVSNFNELGERLLSPLVQALDCQSAYILLPEKDSGVFTVKFSEGLDRLSSATLQVRCDSPLVKALQKQYLTKKDLDIRPDLRGIWHDERTALGNLNIELLFSLINRGNIVGILALSRKCSGRYSVDDINLVESLTNSIAISMEKERYHGELVQREKELSIINHLTGIINSSLQIQDVYETFIEALREFVNVDFATIGTVENNDLELTALYNRNNYPLRLKDKVKLQGSGLEWVILSKKSLVYSTSSGSDKGDFIRHLLSFGLESMIIVPLIHKDEAIGILALGNSGRDSFKEEQVRFIEQTASQISTAVVNAQLYAGAETRSRIDELTNLFNRRHFDESLEKEIRRDFRYGNSFTLMMLDVDHFKNYNDSNGHVSGDKLLKSIARLIRNSTREIDINFRYGGDEFATILPNTTTENAFIVAERVRQNIENEMLTKNIPVTVSIGLASWPGDGIIPQDLITASDRALYYAKNTGTNRCCIAAQILPSEEFSKFQKPPVDEKQILNTIYALAATIEARDRYTYGHSRKVRMYAVALAEAVKLPPEKVTVVSHAALLHDIGKIGIYDTILNKPDALTVDERELIKKHPQLSRDIVAHIPNLTPCLPAILHHHERWDGKGYPHGLKAEGIPLEARILTIADSFDAMISERPYRDPLPAERVIEELKRCAGTQFDAALIKAFLPIASKALNINEAAVQSL